MEGDFAHNIYQCIFFTAISCILMKFLSGLFLMVDNKSAIKWKEILLMTFINAFSWQQFPAYWRNFSQACSWGLTISQHWIIYGLVPSRHQTIIWSIDDPFDWYMYSLPGRVNTLKPSDAYMFKETNQHWFRQWLVTWTVQTHYLNQWWDIVDWTLRNKLQWNLNWNSYIFIKENAFENGGPFVSA